MTKLDALKIAKKFYPTFNWFHAINTEFEDTFIVLSIRDGAIVLVDKIGIDLFQSTSQHHWPKERLSEILNDAKEK